MLIHVLEQNSKYVLAAEKLVLQHLQHLEIAESLKASSFLRLWGETDSNRHFRAYEARVLTR